MARHLHQKYETKHRAAILAIARDEIHNKDSEHFKVCHHDAGELL